MRLAVVGIDNDSLFQQKDGVVALAALQLGDGCILERIRVARLSCENSLIGRQCLIDLAIAMQPGSALHHLLQFGILTARRRGTSLRFTTSAFFSIHAISGLVGQRLACAPDCNLAPARREAILYDHNSYPAYSRNAPFVRHNDRRSGVLDRRSIPSATDPAYLREAIISCFRHYTHK
jgi:hypothetical protein